MTRRAISCWILVAILAACGRAEQLQGLDAVARDYVLLALAMGRHDPDFVDAWYGPDPLRAQADADTRSLEELERATEELRARLARVPVPADEMGRLRHRHLDHQLRAMATRAAMVRGETLPFDDETRRLYDMVAPRPDVAELEAALARIDALLPGEGSLAERAEALRSRFVIPPERLEAVFTRALQECRARTEQHIELPQRERFTLELVTDQPWSGYNWYRGDAESLIQINTDLPIFIGRAIDLGCHEGYPGHHVYNVLLERELVDARGWVEFTLYALFSPQSLIAEGSANFGIDMAFPDEEYYAFERDVLMPLAGIDSVDAGAFQALREEQKTLDYADNEAARRYLEGELTRQQTIDWLVRYRLMSPARAAQRVDFFDKYRGYVINYNVGRDLVRRYVECNSHDEASRWRVFAELLGSPRLPSDLSTAIGDCPPS